MTPSDYQLVYVNHSQGLLPRLTGLIKPWVALYYYYNEPQARCIVLAGVLRYMLELQATSL